MKEIMRGASELNGACSRADRRRDSLRARCVDCQQQRAAQRFRQPPLHGVRVVQCWKHRQRFSAVLA